MVGSFGGYFYINLSHCRVMAIRMGLTVEAFDAALLGSAEVAPPYKPHPEDINEECSAKVAQTIAEILGASSFPEIDEDLARVLGKRRARPDLSALSDAELVAYARSFLPELDNAFARHDYSTLGSAVGPAMLAELCAAAEEPEALLDLISGLGDVPSASPSWGLWRLSRSANASGAVTALFERGPGAVLEAVQGYDETITDFRANSIDSSPTMASGGRTSGISGRFAGRRGRSRRLRSSTACGTCRTRTRLTLAMISWRATGR